MTPPSVFKYDHESEKPWAADCCGVGVDFDTEREAFLWVIDRLWHKLNDSPSQFDVGPTRWRDAMRGDYERLRLIWLDAESTAVIPTEQHPMSYDQAREVAMLHYQAGYENAMRITFRLLDGLKKLSLDASTISRGAHWVGQVIAAWLESDPHSLETEQRAAYNAFKRAEAECAWTRES